MQFCVSFVRVRIKRKRRLKYFFSRSTKPLCRENDYTVPGGSMSTRCLHALARGAVVFQPGSLQTVNTHWGRGGDTPGLLNTRSVQSLNHPKGNGCEGRGSSCFLSSAVDEFSETVSPLVPYDGDIPDNTPAHISVNFATMEKVNSDTKIHT